jgi:hypothetical protein
VDNLRRESGNTAAMVGRERPQAGVRVDPKASSWLTLSLPRSLLPHGAGHRILRSDVVEAAMRHVDRGDYCPSHAYEDAPQFIGHGVTISAPHMHGTQIRRSLVP